MSQPNDSSTGGFLSPAQMPPYDEELNDLMQPWLVGLSAIDAKLVRPLWQPDPPPQPDATVNWMGFGIAITTHDWDAYRKHCSTVVDDEPVENTQQLSQEMLEISCLCYGPNCYRTASLLWNNARIGQNREYLFKNGGIAYTSVEVPVRTTELIKERWVPRCDVKIYLRRAVLLTYPILDVESAIVDLHVQGLADREIVIED